MAWWIAGLLTVCLALVPLVRDRRGLVVGRAERQGAEGAFVRLSDGVTRYRWAGAARGRVLVAIHGLDTPSEVFDRLTPLLGAIGFRVLVYDLFGRGLSDNPGGAHDISLFQRQLAELSAALELPDEITLLGFSMGGAIATGYTATYPERVERLVLLAPAGMGVTMTGPVAVAARLPGLGVYLYEWARLLRWGNGTERSDPRRGAARARVSAVRYLVLPEQAASHRGIARAGVPTVAIWGERDPVVPQTGIGKLAQWNRNARQQVIPGAGHALPQDHAEDVAKALSAIIARRD